LHDEYWKACFLFLGIRVGRTTGAGVKPCVDQIEQCQGRWA